MHRPDLNKPDEPSTEVELSAQDLMGLSPESEIERQLADEIPSEPAVRRQRSLLPVTVGVGLAIVAATAFAAFFKGSTDPAPPPKVVTTWHPAPEPVLMQEAPAPVAEPPVKFRNPFDKTEVFEFPAGTSRTEARDAVAEILMQRALERHPEPRAKQRH